MEMPFLAGISIAFLFCSAIKKEITNAYVENHFCVQRKNRIFLCRLKEGYILMGGYLLQYQRRKGNIKELLVIQIPETN